MAFHRNLARTLLCVVLASLSLTACDPLRDKLASVIGSKSPEETLVSVRGKLDNGKFKEAKAEAEPFAAKPGPRQADFALAAAQACGNLGEVSQAIDYLAIALKAGAVNPDTLMVDRNFESIRTDIRFVTLLTGQAAPVTPSAPAAQTAEPATAIRMDSQAIEVKAGSISIKLPN